MPSKSSYPPKHNILDRQTVYLLSQILWRQPPYLLISREPLFKITDATKFPLPEQILYFFPSQAAKARSTPRISININPSITWIFPAILQILHGYDIDPPTYLPKPIRLRPRSKLFQILAKLNWRKENKITIISMKVTIFDVRIKWQLIALRCGTDPLWKIVIITSSRRLEVGWEVSWKRGIVYIANGSRNANAVKRIRGLSKFQIYNTAMWRDTICWGYLGTAKSEAIVRLLTRSPAFFQE